MGKFIIDHETGDLVEVSDEQYRQYRRQMGKLSEQLAEKLKGKAVGAVTGTGSDPTEGDIHQLFYPLGGQKR